MADKPSNNADFIGRVVGDAKNPPETRMLTGWLGDSGEEGYRRLYTDAELSSYVDIPDDAILYTEAIRDSQPAGAVLVWIKRDAAVKQGGSAFSRAARFLQGQVEQDFGAAASPADLEKAGFHCVTQVPCGEVTGFTGKCTNEPQMGGAWPCITAPPHCFEVTGFTGKCTHQPWPNPTRYFGCTIFHCPTNDLTHIPHICNIVATGLPGCGGVNPPDKGGDPAAKVGADAKEAAVAPTSLPGCGYTKTWGLCHTHLLGCQPTLPPKCQVSVDIPCITQDAACGPTRPPGCGIDQLAGSRTKLTACTQIDCTARELAGATPATVCTQFGCAQQGGQVGAPASQICATNIACNFTLFCPTNNFVQCHPTILCPTRFQPQCFPIPSPFCPVTPGCPFGPGPVITPNVRGGGGGALFGAAAVGPQPSLGIACTIIDCGTQQPTELCTPVGCPPTKQPSCPSVAVPCPTPDCTQTGQGCQTVCGPDCQTQQADCTQVGDLCNTKLQPCTQFGNCKTNPLLECTFGCTQIGPNCVQITNDPACNQTINVQQQAFAAPAPLTQGAGCPASDFVACSQFGGCQTIPKGDCTFFNCPSLQQAAAAGPVVCTQSGPQCPTHQFPCTIAGPACPPTPGIICTQLGPHCPTHQLPCTKVGPACPPTPGIICTQFAPQCPTHQQPCHTPGFECTMFCTQQVFQCNPSAIDACPTRIGCPTQNPQLCPVASGFNCPSAICQSIACQSIACQPQGGLQQQPQQFGAAAFDQSTDFCPTSMGCGGVAQPNAAIGGGHTPWFPTPATRCFICPPFDFGAQAVAGPRPFTQPVIICNPSIVDACPTRLCTRQVLQCNPSAVDACPTRLCTQQFIQCNPSAVDACPTRIGCPTQNPQLCPVATGFNCPSQVCQSIACQPGGGGQQEAFGMPRPSIQPVACPTENFRCPTHVCTHPPGTCGTGYPCMQPRTLNHLCAL